MGYVFFHCLHNFLFVSDFQQFEYDTPLIWESFWEGSVYSARCSSRVSELLFGICHWILERISECRLSFLPITHRWDRLPLSISLGCLVVFPRPRSILPHCSGVSARSVMNPVPMCVRI